MAKTSDDLLNDLTDRVLRRVTDTVRDAVAQSVRDAVTRSVQEEVASAMRGAVRDGEFFRTLSEEIVEGLGGVYREIKTARNGLNGAGATKNGDDHVGVAEQTRGIMQDASAKLEQILQVTEKATIEIMELIERRMAHHPEMVETARRVAGGKTSPEAFVTQVDALQADLLQIMTCLSFQDLTGQRIKRVMASLAKVDEMVSSLYVNAGLMLRENRLAPQRSAEEIKKTLHQHFTQAEVDSLLAGFESKTQS